MDQHTSNGWLWRGRHVKLTDGTTTLMPDTEQNRGRDFQSRGWSPSCRSPNGAILDLAMGPYLATAITAATS
jgi:hypothetical protein